MDWADVTAAASPKKLRQFAGLCLLFFVGAGAWRALHGHAAAGVLLMAIGLVLGCVGLALPAAIRPVYTAWMAAAFPIGWTMSRVMLGAVFYVVFTPVAMVFRAMGRDALRLRRPAETTTYWTAHRGADVEEYLRQF